jgi:glycosyltransferase involved in cell wall biosynthesis
MKVAVVTPTIGSPDLKKCLSSVQEQTYENLTHYVFLDGQEHYDKIHPMLYDAAGKRTIKTVQLEDNVGKGWYGHRVYAACSFIVNADLIIYLDQDNWIEPNHVESLVELVDKNNLSWAYSLRKIYDKDENFICEDNCENLGKWPTWFDHRVHHIDTSCFAVKTEVAVQVGHSWYGKWGADRKFFYTLMNYFNKFECSKKYTMCYRLGGNEGSVNKEFFLEGNAKMNKMYNDKLPWRE